MDDKVWDELLRSPYEDKRRQRKSSSGNSAILIFGVGMAVIIGGFVGWFLAPRSGQAVASDTTTTQQTTTTEQPIAVEPGFLPGYVPLGETAFAPIVQFSSGDRTYVAVSEIVKSEADRLETEPTVLGRYEVSEGSGFALGRRDVTAVAAPGIRLVEFDTVFDDAGMALYVGTDPVSLESCDDCDPFLPDDNDVVLGFDGFPMEIDDPSMVIDLGEGGFIQFDRIVLNDDWGVVDWTAVSDDVALMAQVDVFVYFLDTAIENSDGSISGPASLLPRSSLGPRFGQSQPPAVPGMAYGGSIQLSRQGPHLTSENPPSGIAIRWEVRWTTPTDETASLDAAVVVTEP